ncbi:hypothetical protein JMUB7530_28120 [Staphylococcus aureus]
MAQEVIKIRGGRTLNGEVNISGAKNSAVAVSYTHLTLPTN